MNPKMGRGGKPDQKQYGGELSKKPQRHESYLAGERWKRRPRTEKNGNLLFLPNVPQGATRKRYAGMNIQTSLVLQHSYLFN